MRFQKTIRHPPLCKFQDKPQVSIYADDNLADTTPLKTVLEENGFGVEVMSPAEMPTELVALQRSDVLILSNCFQRFAHIRTTTAHRKLCPRSWARVGCHRWETCLRTWRLYRYGVG